MSRLLLDTNALIDIVVMREPQTHTALQTIVSKCREKDDQLLVPVLCLTDASYVVENGASFKQVLPNLELRRALAARIRSLALSFCEICPIDETIAHLAHNNTSEADYNDALIAECAIAFCADVIISSDRAAFSLSPIPKNSPLEFAQKLTNKNA